MIYRYFVLCILSVGILSAASSESSEQDFEYVGVGVKHTTEDKKQKTFLVKRHIPKECKKVLITHKMLWSESYAHKSVPQACKSTYVHTKGKLLAISLDPDVETYGELEVLAFIKQMQNDPNMLLIDGRTEQWYEEFTIPGAINIPFIHIKRQKEYEFEFEDALRLFGVKIGKDKAYDFSKAKTLLIFCNASWCTQSPDMIYALINIGYPAENLKWYRGGIQAWLGSGMTTTRDVK